MRGGPVSPPTVYGALASYHCDGFALWSAEFVGVRVGRRDLLRQRLVLVEPSQDFLDQPRARDKVAPVFHYVALLVGRRAQQPEHRDLRGLEWEEEIIPPVDHQGGDPDPRKEVDGVHFRPRWLET